MDEDLRCARQVEIFCFVSFQMGLQEKDLYTKRMSDQDDQYPWRTLDRHSIGDWLYPKECWEPGGGNPPRIPCTSIILQHLHDTNILAFCPCQGYDLRLYSLTVLPLAHSLRLDVVPTWLWWVWDFGNPDSWNWPLNFESAHKSYIFEAWCSPSPVQYSGGGTLQSVRSSKTSFRWRILIGK